MLKKLFPIIMILALISGCSNNKTVTKLPENTVKNIVSQKENNSLKNNKDETAELPNPESLIITDNIKETETEIKDEFISSDINEIFSEGTEKKESPVADVPIDESDTISENIIEPIPTLVPVITPTKNPKSTPTPIIEGEINPDYIPDPTPTPISNNEIISENMNENDTQGEKETENDNPSSSTTVKGISVKPNFSQSQELVALQKQGYVKITENSVSANFKPKQSWISPLIYGLNEKHVYYDVTLPYDPQNEEAYLEVLKYALQFSVEKGELIYNKFEEVIRVSDDMTVSMEEWEKYKAENCRKFIKVADNVYYNIYFTEAGQLQLIVSQKPVW